MSEGLPEGVEVRPLDSSHNEAMIALNRACPIQAEVTVCFDRQPDFFMVPRLHFDAVHYEGVFLRERLIGFGMVGFRQALVNGRSVRVFYLGDLRLLPAYRGQGFADCFAPSIMGHIDADGAELGCGLVKQGNRPAEHYVGREVARHLRVRTLSTLDVQNVAIGRARRSAAPDLFLSRATDADLPEAAALLRGEVGTRLFAPADPEAWLMDALERRPGLDVSDLLLARRGDVLVGLLVTWDPHPYKRTVVQAYSRKLKVVRLGYNLLAPIWGRVPLPAAGQPFKTLSVLATAVRGGDVEVFGALLHFAHDALAERGYHFLSVGFLGDDPLAAATSAFRVQRFPSRLLVFARDEALLEDVDAHSRLPFLDITSL